MEYITIKGFSKYEINEKGEIRNKKTKRVLKQVIDSYKCYYRISIVSDIGKNETISVHRLLALTFIPNPLNKPVVDHINRVKTDNSLSNLRWVSPKENSENTEREDRRKYSMGFDCKVNKWLVTIKKDKFFFNDIDKAYEHLKSNFVL